MAAVSMPDRNLIDFWRVDADRIARMIEHNPGHAGRLYRPAREHCGEQYWLSRELGLTFAEVYKLRLRESSAALALATMATLAKK